MKKIRINLYSSEFKPKKIILSLSQMIIIWLVTAAFVCCVYVITYQEKVHLKTQNQQLSMQLNNVNDELMQTQSLVAQMTPNASLIERTKNLKIILDTKKQLMGFIEDKVDLKSNGYAGFMEAMARIKSNGISVTHFAIKDKDAEIEGDALNGKSLPLWISQFRNYNDLSPVVFGGVKLYRDPDSDILHFELKKAYIESEQKNDEEE